jgi:hypothetical protein
LAPVMEIMKSPVTRGYRNKCEFSVGYMDPPPVSGTEDTDMADVPQPPPAPVVSVGFRLATYKKGKREKQAKTGFAVWECEY